ncbi:MAG: PTS IIA-like nitrogen regulatory protein PtsN [Pseudomonadota bacterium]
MTLNDLIGPDAVVSPLRAASKKQAIQALANRASELTGLEARDIFDTLLERERLGSTGIGRGVAIPHGRMSGLERLFGLFARLDRPIDFDASDDQPVDLVVLLLAPEGSGADHLKALAHVARLLRDDDAASRLRSTQEPNAVYEILTRSQRPKAA